jgi:hypothetical protein
MAKKNPWLIAASAGATGKTYEIRTVTDFFLVPEDRRCVCLREFHSWLVIQEGVTGLLTAASSALDGGLKADDLHWQNGVFRWVDDGKGCIGVEMRVLEKQETSERP